MVAGRLGAIGVIRLRIGIERTCEYYIKPPGHLSMGLGFMPSFNFIAMLDIASKMYWMITETVSYDCWETWSDWINTARDTN